MEKLEEKLARSRPFYVVSQESFEGIEAALGALQRVAR